MDSNCINDICNKRRLEPLTTIEADFVKQGKALIRHFNSPSTQHILKDLNPYQILEAYFGAILCETEMFSKSMMDKYQKLCDFLDLVPSYTTYNGLLVIRSDKTRKEAAMTLASASSKFLMMTNYKDLDEHLTDFLICFSLLIGDNTPRTFNRINLLVNNNFQQANAHINESYQTNKSNATSMSGSFFNQVEENLPPVIKEMGGSIMRKQNNNCVSLGMIIHNPNQHMEITGFNISVTLLNSKGYVVDEYSYYYNRIMPKQSVGFGTEIRDVSSDVKDYKVTINRVYYVDTLIDGIKNESKYEVKKIEEVVNNYEYVIRYNLKNMCKYETNSGNAYLIMRDEQNIIIGGCHSYFTNATYNQYSLLLFHLYSKIDSAKKEVYIVFNER